jgi:hypothetical protein
MSSQVSADCLLLPQIINELYGYSLSTPMTCCDNTSIICVNGNIRRIVLESYNLMGSVPGSETITHKRDTHKRHTQRHTHKTHTKDTHKTQDTHIDLWTLSLWTLTQ